MRSAASASKIEDKDDAGDTIAGVEDVQLVHTRLNRTPASPGGKDVWCYRIDVHETRFTGAAPVTLEVEVSDSSRASLPVSDDAMLLLIERAVRRLVDGRLEQSGGPAIEQVRAWPQPVVLSREHFPDSL